MYIYTNAHNNTYIYNSICVFIILIISALEVYKS